MSLLSQKHLQNEEAAYKWVEAHIWPHGAQCPHCFEKDRVSKMKGKATRFGLYKCYACRKQFRVTVGTIFEKSHVPLHLWLQAFYLIAGSKKGISANQLHRTLGVTLKTAWFMGHRIREAMRIGSLVPPMGGEGSTVEVDETIYGRASSQPKGRAKGREFKNSQHKNVIVSLVERGGSVRSYHVAGSTVSEVIPIIEKNVSQETAIMTDAAQLYKYRISSKFASHDRVITRLTSRSVTSRPRPFTPTLRKVTSQCSSTECAALTSTAKKSTFTAIWLSLISGITTAKR